MSLTLIIRTIVPAFWGSVVGWLIGRVPVLEPLRELLLSQEELIVGLVGSLLLGAWVAFANWLAPKLPDWLARTLMGSTKTPQYETVPGEFVQAPEVIDGPDDGFLYADEYPIGDEHPPTSAGSERY